MAAPSPCLKDAEWCANGARWWPVTILIGRRRSPRANAFDRLERSGVWLHVWIHPKASKINILCLAAMGGPGRRPAKIGSNILILLS